ncbi:diguanylate cyclase/phosphodiesterase (GGDEF & EAL domains) with PAS/PAC sensor(s) [hydrothermal vent metagenome]|uniref:Diguanylate cyclase/phosphodiesterase (GGDEF & EAL domains) with PAS/PAC sensor(S) n=1 Tax=hydrothermal vent metagenome TaxID=652676 RepID=A0A1W1E6S0_9ZZZZ
MSTGKLKGSIRKRLTRIIFIVTSLSFLVVYFVFVVVQFNYEEHRSQKEAMTIESVISQDLAKLVFLNEVSAASDIVEKLKYFPSLRSATVLKNDANAIFRYGEKEESIPKAVCSEKKFDTSGRLLVAQIPVRYSGQKVGCAYMELTHLTLFDIAKKYLFAAVLFYLFLILLSLFLAYHYAKRFTAPVYRLIAFIEEVKRTGSLDKRIAVQDNDEFGTLFEETNRMLENLQKEAKEKKKAKEEAAFFKQYDPITGLPNKDLFLAELQEHIDHRTYKQWHILFSVDIDRFNMFNDAFGHAVGDALLQQFAQRIIADFKDADMMGKIGIDDLLLSYRNVSNIKQKVLEKAEAVLNHLYLLMDRPFYVDGHEIAVGIHVGVSIYQKSLQDAGKILRHTDRALQSAKKSQSFYAFYDAQMELQAHSSIALYTDLLGAIKKEQFTLYYQLQTRYDGSVIGAEALVRWIHPEKGMVPPSNFIPVAESSGLIIEIGTWVLQEACRQLAIWQNDHKTAGWTLSVNVSARQFKDIQFIDIVQESISKYAINPQKLKIELTESLLAEDFSSIVHKMHIIRKLGVKISIDDFGTGYSSLQYLKKLPITQIKIDQSFVFDMLENKMDRTIVQMVIHLADAFGFNVIAEGVESKEHVEALKAMGCNAFQGYYFSKPAPIDTLYEQLKQLQTIS